MTSRDEQIDRMAEKLKEWSAELEKMQAGLEAASGDARAEFARHIADLRDRRARLEKDLQQARDATEGAWSDLQEGFEQMTNTLRETLSKISGRF